MKRVFSDNTVDFVSGFSGIFTERICEKIKDYNTIVINNTTYELINLPTHIKSITLYHYNFPLDNLHNG